MSLIFPDGSRTVTLPNQWGGGYGTYGSGPMQPPPPQTRPTVSPDDYYEPAPQLPPGWRGTREELAKLGFGLDVKGRPVYQGPRTPRPPKVSNGRVDYSQPGPRPSRPAPVVGPGIQAMPPAPGMGQQAPPPFIQGPFIPGIGYQPVPNPAYGEAMGLEWDGQKWVKKNPMADLEREAAELALEQKRLELEQAKNRPAGGPDLRDLMTEARQAMKDQRQQRAYAEQLAREMSDEEVAASGRDWRWDGNQMQYTDTPEEKRRLERNRAQASKQQGDANRRREQSMRQILQNSREIGLAAERQNKRKTGKSGPLMRQDLQDRIAKAHAGSRFKAGQAESIPPQDMGTQYGAPNKSDMYWSLVAAGEDPMQAQAAVNAAFRFSPKA